MNIAQALKQKNRIVGEMNEIWKQIVKNNSYHTNEAGDENPNKQIVVDAWERYNVLRIDLVRIKAAIQEASAPIADKLVALAELKSQINILDQISAPQEKVISSSRFDEKTTVTYYKNVFSEQDIVSFKKVFQNQINELQDEVDAFNATTQI